MKNWNWQKYQEFAKKEFEWINDYDSSEKDAKSFAELITESVPIELSTVDIKIKFYGDFNIVITALNKISLVYYSLAVNYTKFLWWFLEALLNNNEVYFVCEEEGPYTYFYVKKLSKEKIRFVHVSDRKQSEPYINYESYKVRQDFIIDKSVFINIFGTALLPFAKKKFKKIYNECYGCEEEFQNFIDEAKIFKEMYKKYKAAEILWIENDGLGYCTEEIFKK